MSRPLAPPVMLLAVTALLVPFGSHPWSWLAGPIASLAVWSLGRVAHRPSAPAPARARIQRTAVLPGSPEPTD
jgi:hypothetical protein